MAIINANPNPVIFPGFNTVIPIKMSTRITWNSFPQLGQVYLVRGGQTTRIDDGGNPQFGGFSDRPAQPIEVKDIQLGETFEVRLTKPNDPNTLLSQTPPSLVKVTTEEAVGVPQGVIDNTLIPSFQGIYDLMVKPGVDNVAMSFRTRQPINPFIKILNPDGERVDLFLTANKQQIHKIFLEGWDQPLAQETLHTYHIFADAMPGSWDPSRAEATGTFLTGSRTATFFFDDILVRNDGDPDSAGELKFQFFAADANTGALMGNQATYGEVLINEGPPPEHVNQAVTIEGAPRVLAAQVEAHEDDYSAANPLGWTAPFADSFALKPPGSSCSKNEAWVYSRVTDHFDVSDRPSGHSESGFQMSTGNFSVAFDVFGRLQVEARAGQWFPTSKHMGRLRRPAIVTTVDRRVFSISPNQSGMVAGPEGRAHQVILSPDGEVYHQTLGEDPTTFARGRLTGLGGHFEGPLTVVAAGPDRVSLFGLSPDGAVLHKSHAQDARPDDDWHTLGGDFVGPVTAVVGEDGAIELFATSEDGSVFHRTLAHPQRRQQRGEWERVGSGIEGSIAALFSPRTGLSLFALGRGGEVLHKRRPLRDVHKHHPSKQQEWKPAGGERETLGVASEGLISAEWVGDEGLLLAVVAEDETVRALVWPDYPDTPPREGWQVIGTVNSLLQGRTLEGEEPTVLEGAEGAEDRPVRS